MPESINTFSRGLNKDISKTVIPKDTYFDARNMRLVTSLGQSNYSIENIKGNNLNFSIPNTYKVYKITVIGGGDTNNDSVVDGSDHSATTITISGQTSATFSMPTSNMTGQDVYNFISADTSLTNFGVTYNVAIGNNYVVVYSSSEDTLVSTSDNLALGVTTLVEPQSNLIPIGFTTIRDDIYIYTTSCSDENPGGHNQSLAIQPSSAGQIWKLTYDIDYVSTLTLIYNGMIDFTTIHPIAPTATLGRYENEDIQRIYWTEFFNPLRSLNVADVNAMAIDPSLLDLRPGVSMDIPLLQQISTGGVLKVGCYNIAYRLKNTNGSTTNFSPLSNNIFIVTPDEALSTLGTNWISYNGSPQGTTSDKKITLKINTIDTDFDRIECFVVIRETLTGTPLVFSFLDEPITSNSFTFDYTGLEDTIEITYNDFVDVGTAFTHCKTIATKDNRLFAGNVKLLNTDIDFDARAYRFDSSPGAPASFDIIENGTTNTYNVNNWEDIDVESDAISPSQTLNRFKSDGTTIGGEGPNISYEFGTVAIKADETVDTLVAGPPSTSPFRHTNQNFNISEVSLLNVLESDNSTIQKYPLNSINEDIKFAYYNGLFKGYQHEEIYRFGITFFDNQGVPMFTKWIGDIKFPEAIDSCPAANRKYVDGSAQTTVTDYSPSFLNGTVAYVNQLYIKFVVNIPGELRSSIGGYEISRLERTDSDKTILACGLLTQTVSDGAQLFIPDIQHSATPYPYLNIDIDGPAVAGQSDDLAPMFDSPEFLLEDFGGMVSGDKIRVVGRLTQSNPGVIDVQPAAGEPYRILKYYGFETTGVASASRDFTLDQASTVYSGQSYSFTGSIVGLAGYAFNNYTRSTATESDSLGSKTLICGLTGAIGFNATFTCTEANHKKLLAYYTRVRSLQYGGNTYTQRGENVYMSCSHFRPIDKGTNSDLTDTFEVFGGDVFSTIYDNQKEIKNWGQTTRAQYTGAGVKKTSFTYFYPTTTKFNTELRYGNHVNYNLLNDGGTLASLSEGYEHNPIYSAENTINIRYSKPVPFIEQFVFDNRVYASHVKINGELMNSWGSFDVSEYWDVEGSYGPINSMDILQSKMLFWQDKAFGILSINPRTLIQDSTGVELQLGTGDVIQRHDYIATDVGCKHQWGMCKSPYTYFFFDIINKRFYKYNQSGLQPLSDVKGMQSYFRNNLNGYIQNYDSPVTIYGITATYDKDYNEAIFTFIDGESDFIPGNNPNRTKYTIAYNEIVGESGAFTSFYDFTPDFYINDGRVIFSMDTSSPSTKKNIYLHDKGTNYCQFYGTRYDNSISIVVNEAYPYSKIFDNLEWLSQVDVVDPVTKDIVNISNETWTEIRLYTDYQNTDYQLLDPNSITPNIKRKERSWRIAVPRNRVKYTSSSSPDIFTDISATRKQFGERMRDKYVTIDLKYNNLNDYRLVFNSLKTIFRVSDR